MEKPTWDQPAQVGFFIWFLRMLVRTVSENRAGGRIGYGRTSMQSGSSGPRIGHAQSVQRVDREGANGDRPDPCVVVVFASASQYGRWMR